MLRYGAAPGKILILAKKAFEGKYTDDTIKKWLKVFVKRFFSQQFKRSCLPDGPKELFTKNILSQKILYHKKYFNMGVTKDEDTNCSVSKKTVFWKECMEKRGEEFQPDLQFQKTILYSFC